MTVPLLWCRAIEGWRDDAHRVTIFAGDTVGVWLPQYKSLRRAGRVRRITTTAWFGSRRYLHGVDGCGNRAAATRAKAAVVVRLVGPFRWCGNTGRAGDVVRLPADVYRKYRGIGSFQRDYERREYRGRTYLHAVTGGATKRGGCGKTVPPRL